MLKQISISELEPGMMVTRVIEQHGPVKIRRVGFIKSGAMVSGLREMGVSTLEIDDAQTISLEMEDDPSEGNANTPTQKLMAEAKQNAATDQAISQNFHRALFMPSVDEMPSKWRLHVRPYAILGTSVFTGFLLGYLLITLFFRAPALLTRDSTPDAPAQLQSSPELASTGGLEQLPPILEPTVSNQTLESVSSQTPELSQDPLASNETEQSQNDEEQNDIVVQLGSDASNPDMTKEAQVQSSTEASLDSVPRSINGVQLNDGETVLGYQAEELNDPNGVNTQGQNQDEEQNTGQNAGLSLELLNRVNQVAAQLESEQGRAEQLGIDQNLDDDSNTEPTNTESSEEMLDLTRLLSASREPVGPVIDLRSQPEPNETNTSSEPTVIQRIDQLPPAILTQMPTMSFSAHMFASNPRDRWVRVNGRRMLEGDIIADELRIVEIQAEKVILSFQEEQFSMNALSDW